MHMPNGTSASGAVTTTPPDPVLVEKRLDFWARQTTGFTTCGYINGNISSPVTCGDESSCLSDTSSNVHLCGVPFLAWARTACLDSTAYVTACNTSCQDDLATTKCTASTNTYCVTMYWNSPIGTNPPMSEYTCAPSPATYSVISAVDVNNPATTSAKASAALSNSNGASTTSFTSESTGTSASGGTSSSSSGLSHNDITYIVVGIVGFFLLLGIFSEATRRWRKRVHETEHSEYDGGYTGSGQYALDDTSHVTSSTWVTTYRVHNSSGTPDGLDSRSEVLPKDSISQVNVQTTQTSRYSDLYSRAPTGSVGL